MANEYTNPSINETIEKPASLTDKFIFKVYLYLAIALAFAGIAGIILCYYLESLYATDPEGASLAWLVVFATSFLSIFIFTIISNIQAIRNRNSVVLLAIYAILWGLFIGCLAFMLENYLLIGGAFLITAVIFVGSSAVGYFMRDKAHKVMVSIATGLILGVLLCSILTFVLIPIFLFTGYTEAYWASVWMYLGIEIAIILYMVILVSVTTYRIRQMDSANLPTEYKHSLAVSCALSLFATFINIFLRILYLLLVLFGNRRR